MKTTIGRRFAKLLGTTIIASFLVLTACEGPQGEPGPAGKDGINGTNGKDGNANVIQVTFNQAFTPSTTARTFTYPSAITTDILNSSAVLVYVQVSNNSSLIYPIPGLVSGDDFRYYITPSQRTLSIIRQSGTVITGINSVRSIIIPSNNNINGRKALPNIDFADYEAVKKYYNLKD
jgi:hypothetical protein